MPQLTIYLSFRTEQLRWQCKCCADATAWRRRRLSCNSRDISWYHARNVLHFIHTCMDYSRVLLLLLLPANLWTLYILPSTYKHLTVINQVYTELASDLPNVYKEILTTLWSEFLGNIKPDNEYVLHTMHLYR